MEQYGICNVAVAHLRAEPSDRAEMTSQLLFGDHVEVLEKKENWWYIRNAFDSYEGWLDFRHLAEISFADYVKNNECRQLVPLALDNVLVAADGSNYYLSPGSNLPQYKDGCCYLGNQTYKPLFEPFQVNAVPTLAEISATALFFKNAPYLWGGRNLFGLDCSGFVQLIYKLHGIHLRRDAWQQGEEGKLVGFLPEVQPGDLAFFDNAEGRITHVGMMLSPNEIIHASGKVRIDPIDDQGIYNSELGKYTHKLRIIKRFVE